MKGNALRRVLNDNEEFDPINHIQVRFVLDDGTFYFITINEGDPLWETLHDYRGKLLKEADANDG